MEGQEHDHDESGQAQNQHEDTHDGHITSPGFWELGTGPNQQRQQEGQKPQDGVDSAKGPVAKTMPNKREEGGEKQSSKIGKSGKTCHLHLQAWNQHHHVPDHT